MLLKIVLLKVCNEMFKFVFNIVLKMILICLCSLFIVKNVYLKLLFVYFGRNSLLFY